MLIAAIVSTFEYSCARNERSVTRCLREGVFTMPLLTLKKGKKSGIDHWYDNATVFECISSSSFSPRPTPDGTRCLLQRGEKDKKENSARTDSSAAGTSSGRFAGVRELVGGTWKVLVKFNLKNVECQPTSLVRAGSVLSLGLSGGGFEYKADAVSVCVCVFIYISLSTSSSLCLYVV